MHDSGLIFFFRLNHFWSHHLTALPLFLCDLTDCPWLAPLSFLVSLLEGHLFYLDASGWGEFITNSLESRVWVDHWEIVSLLECLGCKNLPGDSICSAWLSWRWAEFSKKESESRCFFQLEALCVSVLELVRYENYNEYYSLCLPSVYSSNPPNKTDLVLIYLNQKFGADLY